MIVVSLISGNENPISILVFPVLFRCGEDVHVSERQVGKREHGFVWVG